MTDRELSFPGVQDAFRLLPRPQGDDLIVEAVALAAEVAADGLHLSATTRVHGCAPPSGRFPGRAHLDKLGEAYGIFNCG